MLLHIFGYKGSINSVKFQIKFDLWSYFFATQYRLCRHIYTFAAPKFVFSLDFHYLCIHNYIIGLMKKLILLFATLVMTLTSAWAEDYPVQIDGVQVTSDNYQNITAAGGFSAVKSGSGTVTYDPSTEVLTLSNAVIEASSYVAIAFTGSKIVLAEGTTNTVTTSANYPALSTTTGTGPLTIEGGGTGTFTSTGSGTFASGLLIRVNGTLTIRNCTASFIGTQNGISTKTLIVDNATVSALGTANGSIRCNALTLQGLDIMQPQGAEFNTTQNGICEAGTTNLVKTEVKIGLPELVPNLRYDVSGDGKVTLQDLTQLAKVLVGRTNVPVTGISLTNSNVNILKGYSKQLSASIVPDNADFQTLAWRSSDYNVARVSPNGTVTGTGVGTCTVTATTIDGSNKSASCNVTVTQPVTSITLSPTSLILYNRETSQLTATILPSNAANPTVEWTSSNKSVATVSSTGVVTSLRAGTCTITCTAKDGSGVSATCPVTVNWQDLSGTIDGHAYVDLALPSGTLWAATNIGASNPEDYGNYYSWGETETKPYYYMSNYFDTTNSGTTFITYNKDGGLTELQTQHDAAYVNWSSNWRMPSKEQLDELTNTQNTTSEWTTLNGVNGRLVTSKLNGNSIFFPVSGYNGSNGFHVGTKGYYWSRTLYVDGNSSGTAWYLDIGSSDFRSTLTFNREHGSSVRAVRNQ